MATSDDTARRVSPHPERAGRCPPPVQFYRSAVGKKWVMALTGIS